MINDKKVRTVADQAGKMSGGWFGLQAVGAGVGYGTRYIDKVRQLVFTGRNSGRRAACYYLGIVDALNTDGTVGGLPAEVNAVRHELVTGGGWHQPSYVQGASDANARLRLLKTRGHGK